MIIITYLLNILCFPQVPSSEKFIRESLVNIKKRSVDLQIKCIYDLLDSVISSINPTTKLQQGIRLLTRMTNCLYSTYKDAIKEENGGNVPELSIRCTILQDFNTQYFSEHKISKKRQYDVGINTVLGKGLPKLAKTKSKKTGE